MSSRVCSEQWTDKIKAKCVIAVVVVSEFFASESPSFTGFSVTAVLPYPANSTLGVQRSGLFMRGLLWLGVAVVATMWTETATASTCGHYLYRNGKPVGNHETNMQSVNPTATAGNSAQNSPIELPVRRCSGPNCSENPTPLAPVPPAPVHLIRGFDQMAILESLSRPPVTRDAIEIPESERGARFEPSTIFRPPAA